MNHDVSGYENDTPSGYQVIVDDLFTGDDGRPQVFIAYRDHNEKEWGASEAYLAAHGCLYDEQDAELPISRRDQAEIEEAIDELIAVATGEEVCA